MLVSLPQRKRGRKKGGGASGGGGEGEEGGATVPEEGLEAMAVSSVSSAKNLQEILKKLSLEEKGKEHEFWDSQPVPKLGESEHVCAI